MAPWSAALRSLPTSSWRSFAPLGDLPAWQRRSYNGCLILAASPLKLQEGISPVSLFAVWPWVPTFLQVVTLVLGIFLILIILIQRGKGGGLSGAFGGVGGSSAFGSRAGDMFTRITIVVAGAWILVIMVNVVLWQQVANDQRERGFIKGAASE